MFNSLLPGKSILACGLAVAMCSPAVLANPSDVSSESESTEQSTALTVATWNVEHLASPITDGCRPRTQAELTKLKAYAASLNADIVALQEVASADAVQQVFPADQWQIRISERPDNEPYECRGNGLTSTQQKVAFAVRKGIDIKEVDSLDEFGLQMRGLRWGLEMTVDSPFGKMTILNLHMKSGCFVDDYARAAQGDGRNKEACQTFAQQVPILDAWVEEQEKSGHPYMMLGDFNHRLSAPFNSVTLMLNENSDGSDSTLENTAANMLGCHPRYPAPIDHIFVGNITEPGTTKEIVNHHFDDMDNMLSDHCAVTLTMTPDTLPRTQAVKWQTISKEYRYITHSIYQRATENLKAMDKPKDSWVVVMDIDETILDNSAYQVERDKSGTFYSSKTWAEWVAREDATLVPGAKGFMEAVLAQGGKLALVTNRRRHQDKHTWRNLLEVGLPLTLDNTCLMGRADADKAAMGQNGIINDKDLRRQQVSNGSASCYKDENSRHTDFGKQHIFMQVGDNIEDFKGVLQHEVDVLKLLESADGRLVLLPNPMYGSWR